MTPGIQAIHDLALMGYRVWAEGDDIRMVFEGNGTPNPAEVAPLLDLVKLHKVEVLFFLKCHCPRCGGVITIPDYEGNLLCAHCYWDRLVQLYPGLLHKH